jgi:hypothetical protein
MELHIMWSENGATNNFSLQSALATRTTVAQLLGHALYQFVRYTDSSFVPLLDDRGRTPLPPAPCVQQVLYDVPCGLYSLADFAILINATNAVIPYSDATLAEAGITDGAHLTLDWAARLH